MRIAACALLAGLIPFTAQAAEGPDWAFPVTAKVQPPTTPDDGKPKTAPGSARTYTRKQINDLFNPPDWYPDMHPPMPQVVAHGDPPNVRACAACHLPTGTGHDESAYVAALPARYTVEQMADYKSGSRKGSGSMTTIAQHISDEDVGAAAEYFAGLKPRKWIRVMETDTVPKTYVGPGNKRLRLPGGGKTLACGICHGPTLQGLGNVPPIAGRQATYIVRQLTMIQDGSRSGVSAALMQQVVKNLTVDDMLALAAYVASREP